MADRTNSPQNMFNIRPASARAVHVLAWPTVPTRARRYSAVAKPFLLTSTSWTQEAARGESEEYGSMQSARNKLAAMDRPIRILVLYGSLREGSFSKALAFEAARLLHHLGCDVETFDPARLPHRSQTSNEHDDVKRLLELVEWSDGHFWSSPEHHGAISGLLKTQIDHIPISIEQALLTQGKTLAFGQVNGGAQSFNTVNTMRLMGRWLRMHTIANQVCVPRVGTQFHRDGALKGQIYRRRLSDVVAELVKYTCLFLDNRDDFVVKR